MTPAITGLNHVTLAVAEVGRSVRFYRDLLGFELRAIWPAGAYLEAGSLWLCLSRDEGSRTEPHPDYTHLAFGVDAAAFEPLATEIGKVATIWRENRSEGPSLYFLDPDGHKLEIHVGSLASRLDEWRAHSRPDRTIIDPGTRAAADATRRRMSTGRIADSIEAVRLPHPTRVAIDGRTASGKTTLADELAAELRDRGRSVIRTSVDGFHKPRAERYRRGRLSPEGYLDDARDWGAVQDELLRPLGPGGTLEYRTETFDLERDVPVERPARLADPNMILIVDGTFLQRAELAGGWDMVIFVDVSEEVATSRGVARDAASLGGEDKALEAHLQRYQAAFAIYDARCSPRSTADIVVCNEDLGHPAVFVND